MLAALNALISAAGSFSAPHLDYHALAPEIVLTAVALIVLGV